MTIGPPDGRISPRFQGPATFARLPRIDEVDGWDIAVLGAPFDIGTSYRPGARFGPLAVRNGSRLIRTYNPQLDARPFEHHQVVDVGDVPCSAYVIEDAVAAIEKAASDLQADKQRLVTIGGDHTIALPLLRAAHRSHGAFAVLHFDAHLDTYDTFMGAPVTHGTPFRRAAEEGLFAAKHSLHVGSRGSVNGPEDFEEDAGLGFGIITAWELDDGGARQLVNRIRAHVDEVPVYISVDIDVLDPAHAAGTGTPEVGGWSSRELISVLRGLAGLQIVGADVVEVAPAYDHAETTAIAAANLVFELLSLMSLE